MDKNNTKPFWKTGKLKGIAVATCSHCNAACICCPWTEMKGLPFRRMTEDEFRLLLERISRFQIGEFAFNLINEPFLDKGITEKIFILSRFQIRIQRLFFSSNWIAPKPADIDKFWDAIKNYLECHPESKVNILATVSGIDQSSYRHWQGRDKLSIDIEKPVSNLLRLLHLAEKSLQMGSELHGRLNFSMKAYAQNLPDDLYYKFWMDRFKNADLDRDFIRRYTSIVCNQALISFAGSVLKNRPGFAIKNERHRMDRCHSGSMKSRIEILPNGDLVLCCMDGGRFALQHGNILRDDLDSLVKKSPYRKHFEIVNGLRDMPEYFPCRTCEHARFSTKRRLFGFFPKFFRVATPMHDN